MSHDEEAARVDDAEDEEEWTGERFFRLFGPLLSSRLEVRIHPMHFPGRPGVEERLGAGGYLDVTRSDPRRHGSALGAGPSHLRVGM